MSKKGAESMAEVINPGTSGALAIPGAIGRSGDNLAIAGPSGVNVGALSLQNNVHEQRDNTTTSKVYNINCAGGGDGCTYNFY